jgi:hypothetical protein
LPIGQGKRTESQKTQQNAGLDEEFAGFGAGCEIFDGDISCDIQTKKQTGQIVN